MIVVPAVHPALDLISFVDVLRPGAVQRTSTTLESVGGKAVNIARFIATMGQPVRLVLVGDERLLGRAENDESLALPALQIQPVVSAGASRVDIAIVDSDGVATVVNGTAAAPGAVAVAELERLALASFGPGDVLVLAGSAPPDTPGLIRRLATRSRERHGRLVVDMSGEWLIEALERGPDVVKINADEATELERSTVDTEARRSPTGSGDRPIGLSQPPLLAITDGARGMRAWIGDDAWLIHPPGGLVVTNPLGAGDAVSAALVLGLERGLEPLTALRLGAAMAAARLRHHAIHLDPADVAAQEARVEVSRVATATA